MSASWYATSYRKLFFDFDSPATTVGLATALFARPTLWQGEDAATTNGG
jgi:hypothetical protein